MATLTLSNVAKTYNDAPIIHPLDIDIADGELIVIVGPSGCGKSTLLRMIAGLESLSSGEIKINGRLVNKLVPKKRNIAMVFQSYALYPHMTVYKNMAYGLRMHGYAKHAIEERVAETAELLQIDHLLQRKPSELSGGQRQRVAMGRAMVRHPDVFLFDEPLSNLDASLRVKMRLEIKKLQRTLGTTSLYVTHDQVEAMTLADRLIVLNNGHVEQIGAPLDVYQKPASLFVAGFLGSPAMNFLPAKLNSNGCAVKVSDQTTLQLSKPVASRYMNQEVTLGIRPEHLLAEPTTDANSISMDISMIETLGSNILVYGVLSCSEQAIVARLSADWQAQVGARVQLTVLPQQLHLFDRETGKRLSSNE